MTFEYIVEGPPVPLRAAKKNAKRYQQWKRTVRQAAESRWTAAGEPTNVDGIRVFITNYFTLAPPDIDNIIKPILDAMQGLVYIDDSQVFSVTSTKVDLAGPVVDPSPIVAQGLARFDELVHVVVEW